MPGPGNILIKVGADAGQAVRELATLNSALGDSMTRSQKMSAGLKKAALPAAAALGAITVAAVDFAKAAAEDEQAQAKLAGVLERTTGATKAQVAATEDWIAGLSRATGVADDELRPALGKIATATGDVTKAQALMKDALDIAAASGKSVDTVSTAIAKGYQGQTAALAKLVPGLSEAARTSKDFGTIMAELEQKTGGAMATQAETTAGKFAIFSNNVNELKESLGAALLPVMQAVVPMLSKLATFAQDNSTAITVLVGAVAALAGGILAANVALKAYEAAQLAIKVATAAWTGAQWLLNAALDANPIGAVIILVAALGTALVVAYQKSETFRSIVQAALGAVEEAARAVGRAFDALKDAAVAAFNWVVAHWQVALFAFGPIGAAIYLIVTNFDKVAAAAGVARDAAVAAINAIKGALDAVAGAIEHVIDLFSKIPHGVGGFLGSINPFLVPAVPAPAVAGFGARSSSSGGITVNVYGAVDPEGTARSIRRILDQSTRRQGAR